MIGEGKCGNIMTKGWNAAEKRAMKHRIGSLSSQLGHMDSVFLGAIGMTGFVNAFPNLFREAYLRKTTYALAGARIGTFCGEHRKLRPQDFTTLAQQLTKLNAYSGGIFYEPRDTNTN